MASFVTDLFRKAEELNNKLAGVVSAFKKNNEYLQRKPNDKVLLDMDTRLRHLMKELTDSQGCVFTEMRKLGVKPASDVSERRKDKFDRMVVDFYHKLNNNNIKLSTLLLDLRIIELEAPRRGVTNGGTVTNVNNNGNNNSATTRSTTRSINAVNNGGDDEVVVLNGYHRDNDDGGPSPTTSSEEPGSPLITNGVATNKQPNRGTNGMRKEAACLVSAVAERLDRGTRKRKAGGGLAQVPLIMSPKTLATGLRRPERSCRSSAHEEGDDEEDEEEDDGPSRCSASNSGSSSRSQSPSHEEKDPKLRFMHAIGLYRHDELPSLLAKAKKEARRKVKCSRRAEYDYSKTVAERKANAARWEKTESLRKKVRTSSPTTVKANGDTKYEIVKPSTSADRKILNKVSTSVPLKIATCVKCKKPGSVLQCAKCDKYFHLLCHTVEPPSSKWCQDCIGTIKRRIKTKTPSGPASYSLRAFGGTNGDSEFRQSAAGVYNSNTVVGSHQYLTGAAYGYSQLPSSTYLIPINDDDDDVDVKPAVPPPPPLQPRPRGAAAAAAAAAAASGRDVTVTAVTSSSSSASFPISSASIVRPNARANRRQSSILLNQLSQPPTLSSASQNSSFHAISGQPRWQRRWSSDRPEVTSEVSILDWSESRATSRPMEQQSNYQEVTVELICNNRNEGTPDDEGDRSDDGCVYFEDNDSRGPERDDINDPDDADEQQQAEPEVLNISSGSSEIQSCHSPDQPPVRASSSRKRKGCDNTRKDFLHSIFPGRYGFKIDIYDDNDLSSCYSSSSELRGDDDDEQRSTSRREHVKLEEAHLSAPSEPDLIIASNGEEDDVYEDGDDEDDDDEMDIADGDANRMNLEDDEISNSSSVQQLDDNVVPENNKSDVVPRERKRNKNGDRER